MNKIIQAKEKDLGGFSVRRLIPRADQKMVGPWIFFDHMGPAVFHPGQKMDVRPHPHINLATVTYLFEGEIYHRDSLGYVQAIKPGDINLMIAGKGIVHSERERPERQNIDRQLHALQLWLALPEDFEEVDPEFIHYPKSTIPETMINSIPIRVMMGEAYGIESPVKTHSPTLYIEARLKKDQVLELPFAEERALYVTIGSVSVHEEEQGVSKIHEHEMGLLSKDKNISIKAEQDAFVVLIGGEPLGERHIYWNFVSSRKSRIEQAKKDWIEQNFALIPEDNKEFIPLPEA